MKNKKLTLALRLAFGVTLAVGASLFLLNLDSIAKLEIFDSVSQSQGGDSETSGSSGTSIQTVVETSIGQAKGVVCAPSFTTYGLDTANPDLITPIGKPDLKTASGELYGQELAEQELASPDSVTGAFEAPAKLLTASNAANSNSANSNTADPLGQAAGAGSQLVESETVKGLSAFACAEARSDQWIVAGDSQRGTTGLITIMNPGLVPATVNLTVYDDTGELDGRAVSGTLVAAQSIKTVALAGFGVGKESLVLRVESSGSPVTAMLTLSEILDLTPTGTSQVNAQKEPATELVFAGIVNLTDLGHTDGLHSADLHTADLHADGEQNDGEAVADELPAVIRVFSPSDAGQAQIYALSAEGTQQILKEISFNASTVTDVALEQLPEKVDAIYVQSTTPIVAGIKTAVHSNNNHDFSWYAPAGSYEAGEKMPVIVSAQGRAVIVNMSDEEQTVTVTTAADKETVEMQLPAWGTAKLKKGASAVIESKGKVAAGVVLSDEKSLANYPVLKPEEALNSLTVYPR